MSEPYVFVGLWQQLRRALGLAWEETEFVCEKCGLIPVAEAQWWEGAFGGHGWHHYIRHPNANERGFEYPTYDVHDVRVGTRTRK